MKNIAITAAAIAALATAPAMAQDAGTTIMGNDDAAIGTVLQNDGATVVVDTGTYQVPLGADAFAEREGAWTLNTTKTELEAGWAQIVAEQQAALAAALVVGAQVATLDAMPLGVIEEINEDSVLLTHADSPLALPKQLFALDAEGNLIVLAEMAAIMAALEAQG